MTHSRSHSGRADQDLRYGGLRDLGKRVPPAAPLQHAPLHVVPSGGAAHQHLRGAQQHRHRAQRGPPRHVHGHGDAARQVQAVAGGVPGRRTGRHHQRPLDERHGLARGERAAAPRGAGDLRAHNAGALRQPRAGHPRGVHGQREPRRERGDHPRADPPGARDPLRLHLRELARRRAPARSELRGPGGLFAQVVRRSALPSPGAPGLDCPSRHCIPPRVLGRAGLYRRLRDEFVGCYAGHEWRRIQRHQQARAWHVPPPAV
mmetsp:Transcript_10791/g.32754  ORF Transcript_10791/g.32754 Transcript_10791/m.32754 type:complete len:261 (+) Transcript_10791:588-1370(+)